MNSINLHKSHLLPVFLGHDVADVKRPDQSRTLAVPSCRRWLSVLEELDFVRFSVVGLLGVPLTVLVM